MRWFLYFLPLLLSAQNIAARTQPATMSLWFLGGPRRTFLLKLLFGSIHCGTVNFHMFQTRNNI